MGKGERAGEGKREITDHGALAIKIEIEIKIISQINLKINIEIACARTLAHQVAQIHPLAQQIKTTNNPKIPAKPKTRPQQQRPTIAFPTSRRPRTSLQIVLGSERLDNANAAGQNRTGRAAARQAQPAVPDDRPAEE